MIGRNRVDFIFIAVSLDLIDNIVPGLQIKISFSLAAMTGKSQIKGRIQAAANSVHQKSFSDSRLPGEEKAAARLPLPLSLIHI